MNFFIIAFIVVLPVFIIGKIYGLWFNENILKLINDSTRFYNTEDPYYGMYLLFKKVRTISHIYFPTNKNYLYIWCNNVYYLINVRKPSLDILQYIWDKNSNSRSSIKEFIKAHKIRRGSKKAKTWMMSIMLSNNYSSHLEE